jgi:hypothetical protein
LTSKKLLLRLDRFSFQNDKRCFIEFENKQDAQKAVQVLNDTGFMNQKIVVQPLKADFVWDSGVQKHGDSHRLSLSRYFYDGETSPFDALQPLLEGRRILLQLQTPGWGERHSTIGHNKIALGKIEDHLGKYGIEAVSGMQPFYGDMKPHPRMLCLIDFKTTAGADQAIQEVNETEIDGRTVWLKKSETAPWRAHQIGKVDRSLLAELQEKGLAPLEIHEDRFVNSDKKNWNKMAPKANTTPQEKSGAN